MALARKATPPIGYADAAYADSSENRKSTHGMTLLPACIWTSKKQRTVSTSTTEAEYVSQCQASKQLVWAGRWLQQLGIRERGAIELRCDNQGAIALVRNPEKPLTYEAHRCAISLHSRGSGGWTYPNQLCSHQRDGS